MDEPTEEIAPPHPIARFFDALNAGQVPPVDELFDENALTWHNIDNRQVSTLAAMSALPLLLTMRPRYEVVRRDVVGPVVWQEHVFTLTSPDGITRSVAVATRMTVTDGRIQESRVYYDSARMDAIMSGLRG